MAPMVDLVDIGKSAAYRLLPADPVVMPRCVELFPFIPRLYMTIEIFASIRTSCVMDAQ